jgi:hypothetical protein
MKFLILSLLLVITFFVSESVFAQPIGLPRNQPEGRGARVTGDAVKDLGRLVNNTVVLFFTVGGIGFIVMILWGSVNWILAGGDKEKIAGARKKITTAIIGLALLSLTFVIALIVGQIFGIGSLYTGIYEIRSLLQ